MSKKAKKRNKPYTGPDAKAPGQPTVTRYKAVVRSPLGEWWQSRKRVVKIIAGVVAVAAILVWLVVEAIGLLF